MKLFKKLLVLTISVFTLVGLASCGNKEEVEDYSNLTFEEVFEIEEFSWRSNKDIKYAPGLTMTQLRSKTLDGAYDYYENIWFNLKANYKVKIISVTFSMATNETEFSSYDFSLKKDGEATYFVDERITEMTSSITKTFKLNPEYTLYTNKVIAVMPGVSKGSLYSISGKCTIYNFSFDFEVLGK